MADWEVVLMEWDAQPNGVVAAARPERPPRNVDPVVDNEGEVETWREGDAECKEWKILCVLRLAVYQAKASAML